jgi:PAT family beta-lactamase induction signal transducer AmpG
VVLGFAVVALAAIPVPRVPTRPGAYLLHSFGDPLGDFFQRHRGSASLILALICVYRLSESVLNIMNPFYIDLGFSLTEIAEVRKIFGVAATLLGATAGGFAIARMGLLPALILGAFAQPLSHAGFIWLATEGHHMPALFIAIGLDNIASGFAGTCLIAYMSSLTSAGFTATQYALFSSLYSLFGKIIASQSGRIVEASARSIDAGGPWSVLTSLFGRMSSDAYVAGASKLGVSPAALGSGYAVFFFYSGLVGALGIALAMAIWGRERRAVLATPAKVAP